MNIAENKDFFGILWVLFDHIPTLPPLQLDVVALDTQGDVVWPVERLDFSWLSSASFYWSVNSSSSKVMIVSS